ncbi:MAG: molybdenum ABC transporter ATP-binding protein [Nitrospina sp.]|jgi:molybdate transport system ATP-binding protein|nr:molybdenum ABC transporter ATP-binding protein [Nitrospina sp.]MBT3856571.1 molybdenum ABC transporter ATP-binding protein [Nitrospina sp.]MBT4105065.1 molybdenum ABC transporter ATP-binding protein [Nitrospina sp.]MBT4390737.1 molybdenum ABC transporter ATP-binding protein [Nitrospina sp.]MBT4619478.1 molybdenum ABC transporter ATP-binding protein [Nitrospina sp.]
MKNLLEANFKMDYPGFNLDVELTLPAKGVTVVFGPSGSGKTTLLRCLSGLERAPSGTLKLAGQVWQDDGIFIPIHQRKVGLVFQESRLFPHLSIQQNLLYGYQRTQSVERNLHLDEVVEVLGLAALLKRTPDKLSGGEKQRVAIGRALLTSPKLLLMDEPLASLDMQRKAEIIPFIKRIEDEFKTPIIYVTHSVDEVLQLVDTMVILQAGKVANFGPVQEVFSDVRLRQVLGEEQLGAVLETSVAGHDEEFELTRLDFMGQTLNVPKQNIPVGQNLRVHIHSKDVSLSTAPPAGVTSVLNILQAKVAKIGTLGGYSVDIELDAGQPILATITRKSLANLNLKPGQPVYAHIKAIKMIH